MIPRKQIKKNARKTLRLNYWRSVVVALLVNILIGVYGTAVSNVADGQLQSVNFRMASNTEIVNSVLYSYFGMDKELWQKVGGLSSATHGVLAGLINNITQSGNVVFGILNAANQFVFKDRIGAGITILIGVTIMFIYWLFIANSLLVGQCRFFMENSRYPQTKVNRLLLVFRVRRVRHVAGIMFLRRLYTTLWFLTFVGGFIKVYSYRMVPYLLAENPDISRKEAFLLSRRMMVGYKWKAFCQDASFWGWQLLSVFTFGLVNILYTSPYKNAADAELYLQLRQHAMATLPAPRRFFTDAYLNPPEAGLEAYPEEKFTIPEAPGWRRFAPHYNCHYPLNNLVLIFFTFSIMGWLWEVFVDLVNKGELVNRGTLFGPWLPLYGTGGVLLVLLLRRWANRPALTFILVVVVAGVLEFVTSWVLQAMTGYRWWDYSGYFLNIQGRVCLEGLIVFGIGGSLGIYVAAPAFNHLYNELPNKLRNIACVVLIVLFSVDLFFSAQHPNEAAATLPDGTSVVATSQAGKAGGLFATLNSGGFAASWASTI